MPLSTETGKTHPVLCALCECPVIAFERVAFTKKGEVRWWQGEPHLATCGLPCAGGTVSGAAYRTRQVHGAQRFECPSCSEDEEDAPPTPPEGRV